MDIPKFFDLDEEIRRLTESVTSYPIRVTDIENEYQERHRIILDKIAVLRQKIDENYDEREKKLRKIKQQKDEDFDQLTALKKQKHEEEASKALEGTVDLIKEIVADFAAWENAREYQVEDVVQIVHQYLIGSNGVMNANEMALGKTFETLVALKIIIALHERKYNRKPKILWLSKKSIIETGGTFKEAKRWYPELKMVPIKGSQNKVGRDLAFQFAETGGICILTNYENVKSEAAQAIEWDILVMDEVHKLKGGANSSGPTAIWEAVKGLKVGFQMMLTGTPLVNKIEEIWSYLHLFDPVAFPDSKKFARQFNAFRDISGKMKFDVQSERMLKDILRGRLIRRTAKEVGLQMPQKIEQDVVILHNPEQAVLYEQMRDQFFVWLDQQAGKALSATSILAQLTRLRQINVLPVLTWQVKDPETKQVLESRSLDVRDSSKLDEAISIIEQTQDQVIVFSNFNEPMEELAMRLQVEGYTVGIISSKHQDQMKFFEEDFQQGKLDVLLINTKMGEGMNLHKDPDKWPGGARAVITLDRWWNNAINDQCAARAVRPGAPGPVFIYHLYVEGSIDYFIKQLCDDKDSQFAGITESSELRPSHEWKKYLKGLL